jgi:hypothetical protein
MSAMDRDVALVLAGGLIGVLSSLLALILQRRWTVADRRSATDLEALDLAVGHLMAWEAKALSVLSGSTDDAVDARLREFDLRWEADMRLIPDRESATELLSRCRGVLLVPPREPEAIMAEAARIEALGARVLDSARKRRRELGTATK